MARPPYRAQWTGIAFLVAARDREGANRHYTVGDWYNVAEFDERSKKEHGQFFAVLNEVWAQWPEDDREQYRNVDEFRAKTLIGFGYCTTQFWPCDTADEARRWAERIGRMEPYSIVEPRGDVIKITRAESMKVEHRAGDGGMPRKRFNAAKNACFEHWAQVLDCTVEVLTANSKVGRHKDAA